MTPLAVLFFTVPATDDAAMLLARSGAVLRDARTLSYTVTQEYAGGDEPSVSGTVAIERLPAGSALRMKFAVSARFRPTDTGTETRREATFDGRVFLRRDDPERSMRELSALASDPPVTFADLTGALGRQLNYLLAFPHWALLRDRGTLSREPATRVVAGERCHVLRREATDVRPRGSSRTIERLFVSVADLLPRRLERLGLDEVGAIRTDAAGNPHSLADYRGRVVVLDFWAEWCGPCKDAMPTMQRLHERYRGAGVMVAGIDYPNGEEGETERALAYLTAKGYTYLALLDGDGVAAAYGADLLPTVYVIGPDGRIAHGESGIDSGVQAYEDRLAEIIARAVSAGAPR